jgi:VIT1/CCC1 family predicted Fe2+/Mn2+ transporter
MAAERSNVNVGRGVLQAIFAVFLGLMITAVVGVGVYTFMPNPSDQVQEQLDALYQERNAIQGCSEFSGCKPTTELTAEQQAQLTALDQRERELRDQQEAEQGSWAQRTSIVLIVIATVLMVVSLLLGEALTVLSNGILLGGLFTMLYGVGWGIASGDSIMRFLVLLAALLISILLGYLKFARGRRPEPASSPAVTSAAGSSPVATAELEARVAALESRLAAAAALLGERGPTP